MSTFKNFALDKIWWTPEDRDRKDIRGTEDEWTSFKASIARGIINPPVVRHDGRLVAGERRVTAARELGWSHITVQFFEELSEKELKLLELDENIRRKNLTWEEDALAFLNYHQLCQGDNPDWSQTDTADALGVSQKLVSVKLSVAQAIISGDKRVMEAPRFSVAIGILTRSKARQNDMELEQIDQLLGGAPVAKPVKEEFDEWHPFHHADFGKWLNEYTGPRFNLLHCDFPYGIGFDQMDQQNAVKETMYSDEAKVYWNLLEVLGTAMRRDNLIAPAAHLVFWFHPKYYSPTIEKLSQMGWRVNPVPLIWWRSDNAGILPDPKRGPRQVYETALFASRGDRLIVKAKSNLFPSPSIKQWHMSEKPKPVLRHFFEMLVDETTYLLDPTCGSGNACIVAHQLGAQHILGVEQHEEFYDNAVKNWKASLAEEADEDEGQGTNLGQDRYPSPNLG